MLITTQSLLSASIIFYLYKNYDKYRWQEYSDYNFRALTETAIFRYKTIIGDELYSRKMPTQKIEAKIACLVINKMTALGMPRSVKINIAA